jgi:hypothetical protein
MSSEIIVVWLLAAGLVSGHTICHRDFTDLCVSYSGNLNTMPDLQLKSRFDMETQNQTWKVSSWETTPFVRFVAGNTSYPMDNFLGGRAALQRPLVKVKGVVLNGTSLLINGTLKCLTIMRCDAGVHSYCSKSDQKALLNYHIKKGSYLGFKPCVAKSLAQSFVLDPLCAPGCNKTQMEAPYCAKECMSSRCHYNRTKCYTPRPTKPTRSPTLITIKPTTSKPTVPTWGPTRLHGDSVTNAPTSLPTKSPTNSTFAPTHEPTMLPTREPSKQPSFMPTSLPTTMPTTMPTSQPTESPTGLPTTRQPTTQRPTTGRPTAQEGLTVEQRIGLGVGLGLGLLLLVIIAAALWRHNEKQKKKQGFGGLPPNQPLDTANPPP